MKTKERLRMTGKPFRPSGVGLVAAMAVLLTAAMLAAWWQRQPEAAGLAGGGAGSGFRQDAEQLWTWADEALDEGAASAAWSARWDAALSAKEAAKLADKLGLSAAPVAGFARQDEAYRLLLWSGAVEANAGDEAEAEAEAGGAIEAGTESREQAAPAVLLLEGSSGMDRETLFAVLEEAEAAIARYAKTPDASLSFRGEASRGDAPEVIARLAQAEEAERYEDGGTTSVTYYTDRLAASALSGERRVNLQVAVRLDDVRKLWLVTGGMPLITGEYGSR